MVLVGLHARHVVGQERHLLAARRVEAEQLGQARAVAGVLDDAQLDTGHTDKRQTHVPRYCTLHGTGRYLLGGVFLPEAFVLRVGDLLEHVEHLTYELLLNDLDELVLLQRLTTHV